MGKDGNTSSDAARLDLATKIRQYHHNAIWEEEKHFTWLISIVLSAQLLVLTSKEVSAAGKFVLVFVGSLVGVLLAITGFRVQRREAIYFRDANVRFVEEHNALYPNMQLPRPSQKANRDILDLFLSFFTGKLGVRDSFQFLFLSFIIIFAALAAYAYIVR